jgi:hypothetical protein
MTAENAREALKRSKDKRLHVPRDDGRQAKIDALEDFTLESALTEAELEEAKGAALDRLHELERIWRGIVGWEPYRRGKTDQSIDEAKRSMSPENAAMYEDMEDERHLIRRLQGEIDRLEADVAKASRAYTMLTGP